LGEFRIEANGTRTALVGDLDQAALYGALNRILTLGYELFELTRIADGNSSSPPDATSGCRRRAIRQGDLGSATWRQLLHLALGEVEPDAVV